MTTLAKPHMTRRGVDGAAGHWRRRAWVFVALTPVSFALSMVIGEGLLSLQGHEVGSDEAVPLTAALLAGVPAMLVGVSAPGAALVLGLRSRRPGHPHGRAAAIVGGVLLALYVTINVLGAVVSRR